MSETNLTPEVSTSLPSGDGSEIVAEAGNHHPNGLTRRQFLRLSAQAATHFLGRKFFPTGQTRVIEGIESLKPAPAPEPTAKLKQPEQVEKTLLTPEIVQGVDIYGLNEKIKTQNQIDQLYAHFDRLFEKKLPAAIKQKDRFEQRDYLLNPNERYLEVAVKQSAYQSFLARKAKTGVDFVEWIKMHNDALNRCLENAKPPSSLKARLLRIVVVGDNFVTNPSKYSKDLDATWFIDKDYRGDPKKENIQGYFWSFYHDKDGNLIFRWPPGGDKIEREYIYPPKNDSLTGKNGIWLDFGLTHEWSHGVLNLPDEYFYDYDQGDKSQFRFSKFFFDTGSFQQPWLSPNLAYILRRNQTKRIRGYYTDIGGLGRHSSMDKENTEKNWAYAERPTQIGITIKENGIVVRGKKTIYRARQEGDYSSKKTFPDIPDQKSDGDMLKVSPKVLEVRYLDNLVFYPINWIIRVENDKQRELHLPAAAFNMSRIAGKDKAHYEINFTGYEDSNKKTQILQLVDESDLERYLSEREVENDPVYAKMKVDGTNTWFVWLLRD